MGFSVSYRAANESVDSETVASYFEVDIEPDAVYLGPTYQKFDANWTNKVTIDVKVRKEAQPGTYYLNLDTGKPPDHLTAYWRSGYGGLYTEGGAVATGVGRPYFRLTVTVV